MAHFVEKPVAVSAGYFYDVWKALSIAQRRFCRFDHLGYVAKWATQQKSYHLNVVVRSENIPKSSDDIFWWLSNVSL